jgi:hypothetical protein
MLVYQRVYKYDRKHEVSTMKSMEVPLNAT